MSKPPRRPVAQDVARLAGVSQSAVSRAFTAGSSISESTRKKVMEAARMLKYRPNMVARSLITRRTGIIGVAMGYLDQFNPQLLECLNIALRAEGFGTLLLVITPEQDTNLVLDNALQRQVDGFILASTQLSPSFVQECHDAGIPVILLNRYLENYYVHSVTGNDEGGSAEIARFLVRGGHRSFAFMAGTPDSSTSKRREAGYDRELERFGFREVMKATGYFTWEGASEAARTIFSCSKRPDAIFCASDYMALATVDVARYEFSLRVPEDVSIVGFGDVVASRWPSYNLTTYSNDPNMLVKESIRILRGVLDTNIPFAAAGEKVVNPGELVIRGTARLPDDGK